MGGRLLAATSHRGVVALWGVFAARAFTSGLRSECPHLIIHVQRYSASCIEQVPPHPPARPSANVACYDAALASRLGLEPTPMDKFEEEVGLVVREDPVAGLQLAWGKKSSVTPV